MKAVGLGVDPMNIRKRAKAALPGAQSAPKPSGIKAYAHKKYPGLGKPEKSK